MTGKLYGPLMFSSSPELLSFIFHSFNGASKVFASYLPAHLIACLFSGALWEVIFDVASIGWRKTDISGASYERNPKVYVKPYTIFLVCLLCCCVVFVYFSPLMCGDVSLSPSEVVSREWFDIELNFSSSFFCSLTTKTN